MKRLFWLGVGVATGVAATRKASRTARKASPAGIAENLGAAVHELAVAAGAFGADVRAGMTERESELADVVRRSGGGATASERRVVAAGSARARRADS